MMIIESIDAMKEYFIIAPGFNMLVESALGHAEFVKEIEESCAKGVVTLCSRDPNGGTTRVTMQISKEQHCSFIVMDKKGFENWKKEQMYAQATQGKGLGRG